MALPYVVLNDDVIRSQVLGSARVLAELPQANAYREILAQIDKECLSCSGKSEAIKKKRETMQQIRAWIAGLGPAHKQLLREVLKVPDGRTAMVSYFKNAARGGSQMERVNF